MNHPKADMEVVQTALKRKAKAVQDEARLHPLVAATEAKNGMTGKVGLTKVYEDVDYKGHFDSLPQEDQQKVFLAANDKYKGDKLEDLSKKSKERPENVIFSKYKLASDQRVPEAVRNQQATDLSNMFRDNVGKNSEPDENNNRILSEHKTDSGRIIIKAVTTLASQGNKEAQKAILENPGMVSSLHSFVKYDDAPSDFLESIYHKMREYEGNGTTVMDSRGAALHLSIKVRMYQMRCLVLKIYQRPCFKKWHPTRIPWKPSAKAISSSGTMNCRKKNRTPNMLQF